MRLDGQELRVLFAETVDDIAAGTVTVRQIEHRLRDAGMPQALAKKFIWQAKATALMFRAASCDLEHELPTAYFDYCELRAILLRRHRTHSLPRHAETADGPVEGKPQANNPKI